MKKNRLAAHGAILIAALALASCAFEDHRGPRDHGSDVPVGHPAPDKGGAHMYSCSGSVCQIDVLVGATCEAAQPVVQVPPDVQIVWRLNDPHWKFAANGIEFKAGTPPGTFDGPSGGGTSNFHWHVAKGAQPGHYNYGIEATGPDGAHCKVDPAIWV